VPDERISGHFFSNLLHQNLTTDPRVFKNKKTEERRNALRLRELPRRDSEENLSFWTKNVKKKFFE